MEIPVSMAEVESWVKKFLEEWLYTEGRASLTVESIPELVLPSTELSIEISGLFSVFMVALISLHLL